MTSKAVMTSGLKSCPISPAGLPAIIIACVYATFLLSPGLHHLLPAGQLEEASTPQMKGDHQRIPSSLRHAQKHIWFCAWTLIQRTNYSLSRLSRAQLCPSGGFFALLLPLSKSDIYQNGPHTYHSVGCHLLHHRALSFMFMRKGELLTPAVSHSP